MILIMIRKILILPFFGQFNNYFNLWFFSCKCNPSIDWLIITDNPPPPDLPANIHWIKQSFHELRASFQDKFDFQICLDTPYKLCDYKGFYGYLFSEYISGYDFWGYCDCDLVFGNIAAFLPEEIFQTYDKIFTKGHLSFIRNDPKINQNFQKYETYKIALTTPVIYGYDEAIDGYRKGLTGELLDQGYKVYCETPPVDIDFRHFPFYIINQAPLPCIFTFEHGRLFKITRIQNTLHKEEVIYIHLQKRHMSVPINLFPEQVIIYPNEISPYSNDLLNDDSFWCSVTTDKDHYYNFRKERQEIWKRDFLRLLHEPNKLKCIAYRLRNLLK